MSRHQTREHRRYDILHLIYREKKCAAEVARILSVSDRQYHHEIKAPIQGVAEQGLGGRLCSHSGDVHAGRVRSHRRGSRRAHCCPSLAVIVQQGGQMCEAIARLTGWYRWPPGYLCGRGTAPGFRLVADEMMQTASRGRRTNAIHATAASE